MILWLHENHCSRCFLTAALALPAGDPAGFHVWTPVELKGYAKSLAPKVNDKHVASEVLARMDGYHFEVAHREGSGEGEWHEKEADIFVVQSGEATLVYGGELVDARTTAPGQQRSASIRGGMERKLSPGKEITYFVVKIDR